MFGLGDAFDEPDEFVQIGADIVAAHGLERGLAELTPGLGVEEGAKTIGELTVVGGVFDDETIDAMGEEFGGAVGA